MLAMLLWAPFHNVTKICKTLAGLVSDIDVKI